MSKKLTLNIDEELISFAHSYSKKTHQSISQIVEKFFKNLQSSPVQEKLTSKTMALYGITADQPIPDSKKVHREFHEKSLD